LRSLHPRLGHLGQQHLGRLPGSSRFAAATDNLDVGGTLPIAWVAPCDCAGSRPHSQATSPRFRLLSLTHGLRSRCTSQSPWPGSCSTVASERHPRR